MATKRSPDRVTLHDVARLAGVSVATVSRALNGGARKVPDETVARIESAARALRYVPNLSARAMKTGMSASVGLVVSDIADPYFAAIASGVIGAAKERHLTVTIASSERSADIEYETVQAMRRQGHRSIVIAGSRLRHEDERLEELVLTELRSFERDGGTVVFLSQPVEGFSSVSLDNSGGARSLALKLVGHGYRSFAILAGDRRFMTVEDRVVGFRSGLNQVGVEVGGSRIIEDSLSRDGGYAAARMLIASGVEDLDLVFAASDVMAIGAAAAFRDAGIEVGTTLGLAGFNDIRMARLLTPALTSVAAPMAAMGSRALEIAIDASGDLVAMTMPAAVVLRESSPRREVQRHR
jgi:LacI family transcriptional regulator